MQCRYLTLHNTYSFKVCSISEEEEKLTTGIAYPYRYPVGRACPPSLL